MGLTKDLNTFPEKTSPHINDLVPISDSEASDATKNVKAENLLKIPLPMEAEAFSQELTFNKEKKLNAHTQSAGISFTLAVSGNLDGLSIRVRIIGDSTNTCAFSGDFIAYDTSEAFDNTQNNDIWFFYDDEAGKVFYSIYTYTFA